MGIPAAPSSPRPITVALEDVVSGFKDLPPHRQTLVLQGFRQALQDAPLESLQEPQLVSVRRGRPQGSLNRILPPNVIPTAAGIARFDESSQRELRGFEISDLPPSSTAPAVMTRR
jgi:hypothetical protein